MEQKKKRNGKKKMDTAGHASEVRKGEQRSLYSVTFLPYAPSPDARVHKEREIQGKSKRGIYIYIYILSLVLRGCGDELIEESPIYIYI